MNIQVPALLLAVTSTSFSLPSPDFFQSKNILDTYENVIDKILSYASTPFAEKDGKDIGDMLKKESVTLSPVVINKVLTTLQCANQYNVVHNNILTIIDYSLPSSEKRLWVFDLKEKKMLFNTYVSHGIKSGTLLSNYFSNKYNSKASSIGVYKTDKPYYGRHGLSLKLDGLDHGFNDNASNRAVVMHGGWYVEERFIKKYGRAGRSWGCPAVPDNLDKAIINTIKENSLFVIYYPNDKWFIKSKFLNCSKPETTLGAGAEQASSANTLPEKEVRDSILFADLKGNNRRIESDPVIVIAADNYQRIFKTVAPLDRMLRRQINQAEYIALNTNEFDAINKDPGINVYSEIYFVIPVVKMVRGYYATEMQMVNLGKIKAVKANSDSRNSYTLLFEGRPAVTLRTSDQFIRWLGL